MRRLVFLHPPGLGWSDYLFSPTSKSISARNLETHTGLPVTYSYPQAAVEGNPPLPERAISIWHKACFIRLHALEIFDILSPLNSLYLDLVSVRNNSYSTASQPLINARCLVLVCLTSDSFGVFHNFLGHVRWHLIVMIKLHEISTFTLSQRP